MYNDPCPLYNPQTNDKTLQLIRLKQFFDLRNTFTKIRQKHQKQVFPQCYNPIIKNSTLVKIIDTHAKTYVNIASVVSRKLPNRFVRDIHLRK